MNWLRLRRGVPALPSRRRPTVSIVMWSSMVSRVWMLLIVCRRIVVNPACWTREATTAAPQRVTTAGREASQWQSPLVDEHSAAAAQSRLVSGTPRRPSRHPPNLCRFSRARGAERSHRQHLPPGLGSGGGCSGTSHPGPAIKVNGRFVERRATSLAPGSS